MAEFVSNLEGIGQVVSSLWLVGALGLAAVLLEFRFPRRGGRADGLRWLTAATLSLLGILLTQLLVPVAGVLTAGVARSGGAGLLNNSHVPWGLALVIGFLAYDFMLYAMHRLMHELPLFWRVHRTHHSERRVDASTAILHHPIEPALNMLAAIVVVTALGIPPEAIVAHTGLATLFAYWQHANLRPFPGQRRLSTVLVVPELHEVHHSVAPEHHDRNYGLVLSVWDRLFGTLLDDPALDDRIEFGLQPEYWDHDTTLGSLLMDPIRTPGSRRTIGARTSRHLGDEDSATPSDHVATVRGSHQDQQ